MSHGRKACTDHQPLWNGEKENRRLFTPERPVTSGIFFRGTSRAIHGLVQEKSAMANGKTVNVFLPDVAREPSDWMQLVREKRVVLCGQTYEASQVDDGNLRLPTISRVLSGHLRRRMLLATWLPGTDDVNLSTILTFSLRFSEMSWMLRKRESYSGAKRSRDQIVRCQV